jgi:AraC-like DNA-binding protein
LLLEAKRRLVFTRGSVEELAFDLGFKDPAYFSRFFKKLTDQTPAVYRSSHNYDSN